ncbi:polymer-forming cytoskeletal protein [Fredinandcohnia sp. 179-A 10B2 NHS]|uniref:polymer-forming cytoskeletal protein n=1 Tax=Fredinandcohnia sp. 179-A 10B2 NHS TaxID=3235176 RepID=UPI0039A11B07
MVKVENQGDLIINGMGSSSGGSFNKVSINGKGTVNGNVECNEFRLNGSGTVNGNLKGSNGHISGSGNIEGQIEFEEFLIDGSGTIQDNAFVKKMKISGKGSVGGNLEGEEVRIKGKAKIGGDCEADVFKGEGAFSIGGLLNADLIDIIIVGECRAKEIGGQNIKVIQKPKGLLQLFKSVYPTSLRVDTVEADEIEIENTHAKMVRGNNVIIGPDCEIEVVEYSGTYKQDSSAKVKETRKI